MENIITSCEGGKYHQGYLPDPYLDQSASHVPIQKILLIKIFWPLIPAI